MKKHTKLPPKSDWKKISDNMNFQAEFNKSWILNPYIYPNKEKRVSFDITDSDGNAFNFNPTIEGLINFINGALHHLNNHEDKLDMEN